jgi:3-hydroxyisobutyrate dehydrogenase-like beta-hydroxyacid dehydrogenase
MGHPIARHLLEAGQQVAVWNRSGGKDDALVEAGARRAITPADAATDAEAVVLVLFGPDSVTDALTGVDGIAGVAPSGCLVVDATTIGPSDALEFAGLVAPYGLRYVDAPLFGSVDLAEAGTLASYVGGSDEDVAAARVLLDCWCDPEKVVHAGSVGAGASVKVVRNMAHGIATAAIGECLRLAADLGIPRELALTTVADGPFTWTYNWRKEAIESRDHSQVVFSLDLMAKDLALAVAESDRPLPVSLAALAQCHAAQASGRGPEDASALADWVEG